MAGFYESLNKQNYLKAMSGAYQNYGITPSSINSVSNNGGAISATISLADNIKNAQDTASKAVSGENHDSDPDWFTKVMNVFDGIKNSLSEGILNFADAIGDFGMGVVGGIAGAVGNKGLENTMKKAINTDWQANVLELGSALDQTLRLSTYIKSINSQDERDRISNLWSSVGNSEKSREQLNKIKYGNDLGEGFNNFTSGVGNMVGEMLPSLAIGGFVGKVGSSVGASTAAQRTANIVTQASLGFISGTGKGYSTVAKEDGSLARGSGYAVVKGVISGATRAGSAYFGGSYSDKAMNKIGTKTAEAILGHGGSEKLAKVVSSIASVASDSAIEGGVDFVTSLADPVLKQIYDDNAIEKAYGDDRWKETLANAGMTALTSALTTALVDTFKIADDKYSMKKVKEEISDKRAKLLSEGLSDQEIEKTTQDIGTLQSKLHETQDERYVREAKSNIAVKQEDATIQSAMNAMEANEDDGKLEAMKELQRKAKANEQVVLQAKNEAEKAYEKQNDILRKLLTQGLTEEQALSNKAYAEAMADTEAKVNEMRASAQKANETSDEILQQAVEYNTISKQTESVSSNETSSDGNTSTSTGEGFDISKKANVRDREIVQKLQYRTSKKTGKQYERAVSLGNGVTAKIDNEGKLVYHADSLEKTIFLMNQQDSDDETGRVVRIDREYTGNSTELKVDTSKVGVDEIKGFARTLEADEGFNTSYYNRDTKETYIENTNGSRFMFKDGVYQGMVTKQPEWATNENKQTFTSRSKLSDNSMVLIQQASKIGYISENDAIMAVEGILENGSMMGGNDGSVKQAKKDGWFRKVATAYALSSDENTRAKAIKGAYQELSESISSNGGSMPMSEEDFSGVVKDYLDEVQKHTEGQKKVATLEGALAKEKATNEEKMIAMSTAYRTKLAKLTQAISSIKKYNRNLDSQERNFNVLSNKFKKAGTKDSSNKPYENMNAYVLQYRDLQFSKRNGGISPESLRKAIIDGVDTIDDDGKPTTFIIDYNEKSLEEAGLGYLYDPQTKELIDDLKSHFDKDGNYLSVGKDGSLAPSKVLSQEDSEAVTGLLSRLSKMTNSADMVAKTDRKAKFMPLVLASESLKSGSFDTGKARAKINRVYDSTIGMPERMKILFGEGSQAYNLLVTNVKEDWLNAKAQKKQIMDDMNRMLETYKINQEKTSAETIEYTQIDGTKSTLKKGQAMELYLQSLSPDNYEKLKNDGFVTKNPGKNAKVQHFAINDEIMDGITSQLSESEKSFVRDLFENGYNGLSKNILNKYTTKKYGYSQFSSDNYVNRTMDTDQANQSTDSPDALYGNFVSMRKNLTDGIAKKRNGNRNAMNITDIFQHYDSYADQVARFTCLDNVRELDTAMNMRGSQTKLVSEDGEGKKTETRAFAPDSVYSNFSYIEGGKPLIENWLKVANGMPTGESGTSTIGKVLNNAVATPIGLNPGTYLKMYLDPLRLIGKEIAVTDSDTGETRYEKITWGNFFKGLLNSFNARTRSRNSTDTFTTIQSGSRYYASANMDNYAVNSNVFGAKMNKAMKVFSKPLESANNAMMSHIVFPTMQAFAEANGYGEIGSDSNTMEALNIFDSVSSTALSNGDTLDVSDLRAGRNGGLLRAVFGLYGGDSQKKMEQLSDTIMGSARSKRRVEGLQSILDKYEGAKGNASVVSEYKQREAEAEEAYNKLLDKRDGLGENDDPRKYDFRILMAKNKWDNAKAQTKALTDSLDNIRSQIDFEKNHVQDKKNNVAKAGYVFSAFAVACAVETGINALTSKMKDKDDESTMADYAQEMGSSMLVDWIPYIGTIASAFKYSNGGFTPLQFQGLEEGISAIKGVASAVQNPTGNNWNKAVLKVLNTLGYSFGVPVKNFIDYFSGAIGNIDNVFGNRMTWVAKTNAVLKGYNSSTIKTKATNYAKAGNLSKATEYTQANMAFYKAGAVDWNTAREIARTGASVKDRPTGTQADTDRFMNTYAKSNTAVSRYMRTSEYRSMTDDEKGNAITKIYTAYYELASAITNQDEGELNSSLSKILYRYFSGKSLTNEQKKVLRRYKII